MRVGTTLLTRNVDSDEFSFNSLEAAILRKKCKGWYLPYRLTEVPWNMAEVIFTIIFNSAANFELVFFLSTEKIPLKGHVYPTQIKSITYQDKDEFFRTDEGLELTQSYWEDEEKLVDKKFARLEAKGDKSGTEKREEIEKKRREVKENLTKVMKERGRKVEELKEKVGDPTGGEGQVVENGPKV